MKKIAILFTLIGLTLCGMAQIPNAGFEEWESDTKASAWNSTFTFNRTITYENFPIPISLDYTAANKSTITYSGSYSMKLLPYSTTLMMMIPITLPGICQLGQFDMTPIETMDFDNLDLSDFSITDVLRGGVACNEVPLKVKAWVRYPNDEDTSMVIVYATRNVNGTPELVAEGYFQISEPLVDFTQIEVPIDVVMDGVTPDTLNIIFLNAIGEVHGTNVEMYIDDVTLETSSGIYDVNSFIFSVMPNPATDQIILQSVNNEKYDARLYDMNGRIVWSGSNLQNATEVNVSDFATGTYVMQVKQNGKVRTDKIMIQ